MRSRSRRSPVAEFARIPSRRAEARILANAATTLVDNKKNGGLAFSLFVFWLLLSGIYTPFLVLAGCLDGGPPEGSVRGTLGGAPIDLTIDASSVLVLQAKTTCAGSDTNRFSLDYGGGAFHIEFDVMGVSVLGDMELVTPPLDNGPLSWFEVDAQASMVSATITVGINGVLGRRSGVFHVVYADGGVMDGDFDLTYESRGDPPSCGGGGGDWDD